MLNPAFLCYAPGSRHYADLLEAGEDRLLLQEVRRTIGALDVATAARISRGLATAEEAVDLARTWSAIADDLEGAPTPADVAWSAKVEALQRELGARRSSSADDVAKGRLTAVQAREQLERLEAVHVVYLRSGLAFDGTLEEGRALNEAVRVAWVEQEGAAEVQPRGDSSRVEHSALQPTVAGLNPAPRSIVGATT